MTYRAALLTAPRQVSVRELAEPTLGAHDVLVRVRSTNLCPTDVKKWQDDSLARTLELLPLVLGHEIAGVVEAVGAAVKDVELGTRVAIDPILPCGACAACVHGQRSACTDIAGVGAAAGSIERNARMFAEQAIGGGFAELVKVPRSALVPLPDDLSFSAASLIEPLADVMHAIDAGGDVEGRRCVVYGLGPMGLLHVQALVHLGANVIGADPRADRRATALAFGSGTAVAPDDVPTVDRAYVVTGGPALVAAASAALDLLDVHGSVVLFASGPSGSVLPIDVNRLHYQRQRVVGVVGFEPAHADTAIDLLCAGAIDVDALRTPRIELDDLQAAFEGVGGPNVLKPAIDFP